MKEENILEKTGMRKLRRIKGVTVKDKMKSEDIRKELGVGSIKSKARESRLKWFGHVHHREQESNLRQVMDMEIPGRRPRGRPRGRWRDLVDWDMRELPVVPEDADDRRPLPGIRREKRREEKNGRTLRLINKGIVGFNETSPNT